MIAPWPDWDPLDHEFDDPDCACDECQVDRDDEENEADL
jgi:hypothetical protein